MIVIANWNIQVWRKLLKIPPSIRINHIIYVALTLYSNSTESDPICEPQQTSRTSFLNGNNALELSCTVGYWGCESPSMQWNILDGPPIPSNNTTIPNTPGRNMLKSFIKVVHNSTLVGQSSFNITCTTSVASNTATVRTAKNLGYTHVWYSQEISIDWREYLFASLIHYGRLTVWSKAWPQGRRAPV